MRVEIVEVGPRDGLQNEKAPLSPEDKAELIRRSTAAGLRRVESVSFVSSKAVPQMAAAEEAMARTERVPGVSYSGLVLNPRGLTRAIETGMDEVNVVLVASETLSQRNQGATIGQMVGRWRQIVAEANGAVPLSVAIAAAFGCPFEGEADPELVARLAGEAYDGGAVEISLAESIGVGVPAQVRAPWRLRCRGDQSRGTWRGRRDARLGSGQASGLVAALADHRARQEVHHAQPAQRPRPGDRAQTRRAGGCARRELPARHPGAVGPEPRGALEGQPWPRRHPRDGIRPNGPLRTPRRLRRRWRGNGRIPVRDRRPGDATGPSERLDRGRTRWHLRGPWHARRAPPPAEHRPRAGRRRIPLRVRVCDDGGARSRLGGRRLPARADWLDPPGRRAEQRLPGARRVGAGRQPRHGLSAAYRGDGPARACRGPEVRHP
ncbi:hypothetical protein OIE50_39590 [Streptomyces canus]